MGPLCVRPDRQLGGLGKEIVVAAADWLKAQGAATVGLETMPRTVDNIGFYGRLGFVPGHLTLTMTADTGEGPRASRELAVLGRLSGEERAARRAEIAALVEALVPGVDFSREIDLTLQLGLGDVVLVGEPGRLGGFALCHAAPLAEGGGRDEVRALKIAAADLDTLGAVLDAAAAWASRLAVRRLAVRCQTGDTAAYQALVARGYRVRWSDLRMTLADFPERRPASGVLWSNWEI
jgi:hypothetical protein